MIFNSLTKNGACFIKSKIFNISLIVLILSGLYIFDNNRNSQLDPKYEKIKEFEQSHLKSFIKIFFSDIISDMKNFREINYKKILLDNKTIFTRSENPDVSVIITIYNQANCFFSALRSVQNQSLKNIEIIIIDDCSLDNTTEVIELYMKEDSRIIYLRHESNDGKIKSRTDGVRIAKGKYITIIDGDDSLSNENILYNCFSIAQLSDLDVVGFNLAIYRRKNFMNSINYKNIKHLYNRIIYQPELSFKFVSFEEKDSVEGFSNRNIVAKLIKTEIFKKVLEYIGPKYTEDFILEYEDTIMSVSLFHIANSFYNIKEFGYYYAKNECEEPFQTLNFKKCKPKNFRINNELDPIKYLNFLLDIYKGKEIEKYLLYKELISIDYYKQLKSFISNNFSYVYLILDKINKYNLNYKERKYRISNIKDKLVQRENIIKFKGSLQRKI